ncbi:MAG: type I methionyl aminopeptidase [Cytophagales bacterium]|nr:type I methionyl aminopeptidase [Cytophagales bacterium]
MSIQSIQDLEGMTLAGKVVGETLNKMLTFAKPGMSTKTLDDFGYEILKSYGANPAPQKEYGFPGWNCISVNHEVAHGIPSNRVILQEGDLVNVDVSAEINGYYGDNGASFVLGRDTRQLTPLVNSSKEILYKAISKIRGGVKIAAIGALIENEAKKRGFTTIKNLVGHGIGMTLHDHPHEIPCFADRTNKYRFRKDTVIALETFISTKARMVRQASDGWTFKTPDGSFVAQHEHTLIVTDKDPVILTANNGV